MRVLRDAVLTLLVLVILGGLAAYLFARGGGLSARRQPGTFEYAIATRLRNTSAAAQAGDLVNPLAGKPDTWRAATLHYAGRCAMCHNLNGKGATVIASNVSPPPPDLTQDDTQRLTDAQLFAIIRAASGPAAISVLWPPTSARAAATSRRPPACAGSAKRDGRRASARSKASSPTTSADQG